MSERADYLIACFDLNLGEGDSPHQAWRAAVLDYALVYGPNADPDRTPLNLAPEREAMKINLTTEYNDSGAIVQRLSFGTKEVCSWVVNTRERQIREALIALGWTPPLGYVDSGSAAEPELRVVEEVWQQFWRTLVVPVATGLVSLEMIKKELYDYRVMMGEVSRVYDAVTGGLISKPNTCAEAVIAEFEDRLGGLIREGVEDELEALDTEQNSGIPVSTVGLEDSRVEGLSAADSAGGPAAVREGNGD